MLYRTIVHSKLDYGCIVYGTASSANLRQLDSIHNAGLRLALGTFCTSPVSSMYTETNETPLEERRLKLSMHYYLKTRAEDTENPLICHIMNLLWALSDKGTRVSFCWVPSHCGIEGNEIVDQLAKETLDHDIDPLATVHYADLKPVVNSYIQQEVQIKWDVSIHGRDLYLLKPTLGPPKKFKHLTRAEEVVITRLRIGHTKATKSHILSRGPPTACQHCGQTLTIEHMLLECTVLQQIRDEYYTADSLRTLFETIPETCIVEFLKEAGLFYLIWKTIYPVQHIIRITHQLTKFGIHINHHILTPLDSCNLFI